MTTVLPGESSEKMVWEAVACNEVIMTNQEVAFWGGGATQTAAFKTKNPHIVACCSNTV